MELLNDLFEKYHHTGRLAVKDKEDEDSTVYVVWEVNEDDNTVFLVELDRPQDGDSRRVNLNDEKVYLLNPLEVVERVIQWK